MRFHDIARDIRRRARAALHLCVLTAATAAAQQPFSFHCKDYVKLDDRVRTAVAYDEAANTFTIRQAGANNTAFGMDKSKDGAYYFSNKQNWFVIRGTNLSAKAGDSQVWWFNGFNNARSEQPAFALAAGDGSAVLAWDLRNAPNINGNVNFQTPRIVISGYGGALISAIGLTATADAATVSDIRFCSGAELALACPEAMGAAGYASTDEIRDEVLAALQETIGRAAALLEGAAESDARSELGARTAQAQSAYGAAGTDAATLLAAIEQQALLEAAVDAYRAAVPVVSWTVGSDGLSARCNDVYTRVTFYGDNTVRVVKTPTASPAGKASLSVVAAPEAVAVAASESDTAVVVSAAGVAVRYRFRDGRVEVLRPDGTPLVAERDGAARFTAKKDGPFDSFTVTDAFALDDDEQIYGLGQIQNGLFDQRGQTVLLEQANTKVCIPYFESSKNYGLFWDNYSPTTFADNAGGASFTSTGNEIDYYVMAGDDTHEVLSLMRALTGRCPMPPLWSFGLYQSRQRYTSTDEVREVVSRYRALGVPLDCVVQDWQYWGGNDNWNALAFENPLYSDARAMIDDVHAQHAKFMVSIWANFGPASAPYKELDAMGRLMDVGNSGTYPPGYGVRPYDCYSADARGVYWRHLYNGLVSKGVDAYWMDSTEPDYYGAPDAACFDYVSGEGRTWRSLRNAFPLAQVGGVAGHHRAAEAAGDPCLAGKRVAILTRSAFAGQQRTGANTWSGDVTASWAALASQIPAGCSLSACGIPYWNSDIGGFFLGGYAGGVGNAAWRRLYMRWMQFGTFCPMMRFHGDGTPREIYQFGSKGDHGDFDHILKYVRLRYRLAPYLYSTAWQVSAHDGTFMRALPAAFRHDRQARGVRDEYMFGDAFLVAPVVTDNATRREVYLPEGEKWVDFWTGRAHEGGQTLTAEAAMDVIPLYVRAGTILPWGPDVQYMGEKDWDSLEVRVYPGGDGRFTLYEDAADGYGYERGECSEIPFAWDDATSTLTIGERRGRFDGMLAARTFRLCLVSEKRGTGDRHETRYLATVGYDGTATSVVLAEEVAAAARAEDCTALIANPSFETGTTDGWDVACNTEWSGVNRGGGTGDPEATDGQYIFGAWDGSAAKSARISQTLSGLPAGTYVLSVDMHASNRLDALRVGDQQLFANDSRAFFRDQVVSAGTDDTYPMQPLCLTFVQPEDNRPVTIGVATGGAPAETWFKIDNFRLERIERPVVALDENTGYAAPAVPTVADVQANLTARAGQWRTLCLPFDLTPAQGDSLFGSIQEAVGVERTPSQLVLTFAPRAGMQAGRAYLVRPRHDGGFAVADATLRPDAPAAQLIDGVRIGGTYAPTATDARVLAFDGVTFSPSGGTSVPAYRAVLALDDPDDLGRAVVLNIDGVSTSIGTAGHSSSAGSTDEVFTLGGVRVRDVCPGGVYVVRRASSATKVLAK